MTSPDRTSLQVTTTIALHLLNHYHAQPLFNLLNANRLYLRQWLPWVDKMQEVDNMKGYIAMCLEEHQAGISKGYTIEVNGVMAGRIGLHYIDASNQSGAIGYWLSEEQTGKGIITRCGKTLLHHAFQHMQLNRIEIKCATGNNKSIAIAERLGFTKEGILRQAAWMNGRLADYIIYSLLREEWK